MVSVPPIKWDAESISGMLGSISIACWVVVFVPQIYKNWARQSADGLSVLFVVLWLAGDVFNLVGALMQHLLFTMILLAAYYTIADIVLLAQCLRYDEDNNGDKLDPVHLSPVNPGDETVLEDVLGERLPLLGSHGAHSDTMNPDTKAIRLGRDSFMVFSVVVGGFLAWYVSHCLASRSLNDVGVPDQRNGPNSPLMEMNWLAQLFGYLSAILYLGSRVPQILLNYQRKSCDGVSFLFFAFACLGNSAFIASVLAISLQKQYLIMNASWLLGSSGTLLMDFVIFSQFFIYGNGANSIQNLP